VPQLKPSFIEEIKEKLTESCFSLNDFDLHFPNGGKCLLEIKFRHKPEYSIVLTEETRENQTEVTDRFSMNTRKERNKYQESLLIMKPGQYKSQEQESLTAERQKQIPISDFCSGDWRITGWLWAGVGWETTSGLFYGWSYWVTGDITKGNWSFAKLLPCGECACDCPAHWWSHGPAIFKKKELKVGPIDCGVIANKAAKCAVDIELICLADISGIIAGPIGNAIKRVAKALRAEIKLGGVGSSAFTICAAKGGGITASKVELCIGIFVEAGWANHPPQTHP